MHFFRIEVQVISNLSSRLENKHTKPLNFCLSTIFMHFFKKACFPHQPHLLISRMRFILCKHVRIRSANFFYSYSFKTCLWSPAGKVLTSWLSFVVSTVSLSLSHWDPGSGVRVCLYVLCGHLLVKG